MLRFFGVNIFPDAWTPSDRCSACSGRNSSGLDILFFFVLLNGWFGLGPTQPPDFSFSLPLESSSAFSFRF